MHKFSQIFFAPPPERGEGKIWAVKNLSNLSLGCLERWKFPCMIIEGLQYGFGELYWRTKPRVSEIFFFAFFWKRPVNLKKFYF